MAVITQPVLSNKEFFFFQNYWSAQMPAGFFWGQCVCGGGDSGSS